MLGIEDKLFAIFFSFCMLAQAYIIRLVVGTYIFPAVFFSFAWFIFTFVPLVILARVPINPLSILFILACTTAFTLSSTPFNWSRAIVQNSVKEKDLNYLFRSRAIHYFLYLFAVLSVVTATLNMISNGFDLHSVFFNLLKTSGKFAELRGHGNTGYGALGVISIFFTYMTPILGGFVIGAKKTLPKRILFLFIAIAPAIYFMLIQSSKIVALTAIVFLLSSMVLMKIFSGKLDFSIKLLDGVKIVVLLFILFSFVMVSFVSRGGYSDFSNTSAALKKLFYAFNSYAFGQPYAFSDFFSYYLGMPSFRNYQDDFYSYGYYTFKPIFDALGGTKSFPPGFYDIGFSFGQLFETVIFTAFRGLIVDFGALGTIVFMYIFGYISHFFYYRLLYFRNSWVACIVFMAVMNFIALSYLISVFTSRYMFLIGLSLFFILKINNIISKKRKNLSHLTASL